MGAKARRLKRRLEMADDQQGKLLRSIDALKKKERSLQNELKRVEQKLACLEPLNSEIKVLYRFMNDRLSYRIEIDISPHVVQCDTFGDESEKYIADIINARVWQAMRTLRNEKKGPYERQRKEKRLSAGGIYTPSGREPGDLSQESVYPLRSKQKLHVQRFEEPKARDYPEDRSGLEVEQW